MTFRLSNVAYKYKKSALPVLERIEGVFPAGGTVAILGRSGSGKTTLLSLLGLLGEEDGKLHEGAISYTDATGHDHPYAALSATNRTRLRAHRFGFIPANVLFVARVHGGAEYPDAPVPPGGE